MGYDLQEYKKESYPANIYKVFDVKMELNLLFLHMIKLSR